MASLLCSTSSLEESSVGFLSKMLGRILSLKMGVIGISRKLSLFLLFKLITERLFADGIELNVGLCIGDNMFSFDVQLEFIVSFNSLMARR